MFIQPIETTFLNNDMPATSISIRLAVFVIFLLRFVVLTVETIICAFHCLTFKFLI